MRVVQKEETMSQDIKKQFFSGSTQVYVVLRGGQMTERARSFSEGIDEMRRLMTYIGENFPPGIGGGRPADDSAQRVVPDRR